MSMLERYKKKGGFIQLLNLIETSEKAKQEKFLKLIAGENSTWEPELRKKMLTIEKVMNWNPIYLREIFPRMPALQLAMIVGGLAAEKAEKIKSILTSRELKNVNEILEFKVPNASETVTGQSKLFTEIRKMLQEGLLKTETVCPEMSIAQNIEEQLNGEEKIKIQVDNMSSVTKAAEKVETTDGATKNVSDEIQTLKKKVTSLTQENQNLMQENKIFRDKLAQIKKIA